VPREDVQMRRDKLTIGRKSTSVCKQTKMADEVFRCVM